MSYSAVIDFLKVLDKKGINTVLRRVIIPGLNDKPEDSECLVELSQKYSCVKNKIKSN